MGAVIINPYRYADAPYRVLNAWSLKYLGRALTKGFVNDANNWSKNNRSNGHGTLLVGKNLLRYVECVGAELFLDIVIRTTNENSRGNDIYIRDIDASINIPGWQNGASVFETDLISCDVACNCLNAITQSRVDETRVRHLLEGQNRNEKNGWKNRVVDENFIEFKNESVGRSVCISIKDVMEILEWSYSYLEVLYDEEFWYVNADTKLRAEYRDPLLDLFSYVRIDNYYALQYICEDAVIRKRLLDLPPKDSCTKLLRSFYRPERKKEVRQLAESLGFRGEIYPESGREKNGWVQESEW